MVIGLRPRASRHTSRRCYALLAIGLALGCAANDDLSSAAPLRFTRTVAEPGVGDDPVWISLPGRLLYDPDSRTLFTRQWRDAAVHEFDRDGGHVRTYGGREGEGPGEIKSLRSFAITRDLVAAHDAGSTKLLLFSRRDGTLMHELQLNRLVSDFTFVGDTAIALVPGSEYAAFDLLGLEGDLLGSLGDGGFLAVGSCHCVIRDLGEGRLVVVQTNLAEGRLLDLDGNLVGAFGFDRLATVLAEWSEDFRETLRLEGAAIAEGGSGRVSSGKNWIGEVVPLPDGEFYVTVVPERLRERPIELWRLDASARVVARFAFDRTLIGSKAAGFPTVYGVGITDGGIHEFVVAK